MLADITPAPSSPLTQKPDPRFLTEAEFTLLYEQYQRPITKYVKRIVQRAPRLDAEDLAQEAFLKAWSAIQRGYYHENTLVKRWLYTIATRVCIDAMRRKGTRAEEQRIPDFSFREPVPQRLLPRFFTDDPQDDPERVALDHEQASLVEPVIATLIPQHRTILRLRVYHGFTYLEIVDAMGISYPAVKALLLRARIAFRAAWLVQYPERVS